jgi:hypothetical protein
LKICKPIDQSTAVNPNHRRAGVTPAKALECSSGDAQLFGSLPIHEQQVAIAYTNAGRQPDSAQQSD